uniref:PpGpp synthetase catalytic domain-containing protein (RelA/SpoT-type nucleotidyltranferase) n=1 Tax=Candidatus Kentrum sp. TUN TaxID=2126343 RepID=A0A451A6R5_9GAMM|nr:MAG: ppGpp synthetase catalytic domain-containing protein (RelA/SpoT-type nucleotidyltranferase) [Candidatus Kentron sp. TUN]
MEMDREVIMAQYDAGSDNYKKLTKIIEEILRDSIVKKGGIKIHSITSRVKSFDSFMDKLKKKKFSQPFKEIHDLVGFRIVCLFLSDLSEIRNIIREEFNVFEEDDKINDQDINIFGYMSLHVKAKLKDSVDSLSMYELNKISFEIQIRTIAQDAWASISHYLNYKRNTIPDELKRDFYALSSLFYVADTHFLTLQKEYKKRLLDNHRS